MEPRTRRDVLAAAAAAAMAAPVRGAPAEPPHPAAVPAFAGNRVPKPLPFDPAKLTGLSEKLIRSHWENNYGGAVKALNAIEARLSVLLDDPDSPPFVYGPLKREELLRTGSVVLHDLYFENLGGDGKPGGEVRKAITTQFGSFERWQAEFQKTALSLAGGSGWVVLARDAGGNSLHNYWMADHAHAPVGARPLVVLDMYEHAFQMDYGAAAAKYVEAFWRNVNWETVERRFASA